MMWANYRAVAIVSVAALLIMSCNQDQPKVTLEFHRAEMESGDGLTEASVPGWPVRIYLQQTSDVTEADIEKARIVEQSREPDPIVELIFTAKGSKKMAMLTEEHLGKLFSSTAG